MKGRYFMNEVVLKASGDDRWKLQIKDAEWLDLSTKEIKSLFTDAAYVHHTWHVDLLEDKECKQGM